MAEPLNQDCPDCGSKRTRVLQTRKLGLDDLSIVEHTRRQLSCHNCGCVWDIHTKVTVKLTGRASTASTPNGSAPVKLG